LDAAKPWSDAPVDLAALSQLDAEIDEQVLGPAKYNFAELAEASGWQADDLTDLFLWSGTPLADTESRSFTEGDLYGLIQLRNMANSEGLDVEGIAAMARSLSYSMERLALTEVEAIVQHLSRKGLSDTEARAEAARYAPTQSEMLLEQIATLWRRHFAAAIHRLTTGAILHRGVSDDDQQLPLVCAVGYARISDFVAETANFDVAAFAKLVQDFHNLAGDTIIAAGGRIIKYMGDFIVWVTATTAASADIALQLVQMQEHGFGTHLQVSVVWSRVMSIHGDIFGPGVNLAVRLAELAPEGGVLIDDSAANQIAHISRFNLCSQPEFEIKGMGPAKPFLLTAADG
jgi:adenylate cyclase